MVRYTFLVGIFPPRLHAGLSPTIALPCGRGSEGVKKATAGQDTAS
jgi:hypothetical protein